MTQWPPELKTQEKVPRKLRTWRFTSDGPFWGAFLSFMIWASVCAYLAALAAQTP